MFFYHRNCVTAQISIVGNLIFTNLRSRLVRIFSELAIYMNDIWEALTLDNLNPSRRSYYLIIKKKHVLIKEASVV